MAHHQGLTTRLCLDITDGRIYWSEHLATNQLERPNPSNAEIRFVACEDEPQVIEDYPEDPRGASCLIHGVVNGRALHVCYGYSSENSMLITAYWPDTQPDKWDNGFKRRVARQQ